MKLQSRNNTCLVIGVLVLLFLGQPCRASEIRAFSLREADRLIGRGLVADEQLRAMGGITRFAGMVFDGETQDVVLIGRARKDLPPVMTDDLVVALRSRLWKKEYPRVSIDRVDHTERTGMQDVRFTGGIEGSGFGSDFLKSDIVLKRYSLDLLKQITGIDPYLKLYETATKEKLAQQSQPIEQVNWLSEEDSQKAIAQNLGKAVSEQSMVQSRFWFHVRADQSFIVERDDVYVIEELSLGVKTETLLKKAVGAADKPWKSEQDKVGDEFARQFTAGFQSASTENPVLHRLKVLFDLVAIAEGIAHLESDRPALHHLIDEYRVKKEETPATYRLVQRVGEFRTQDKVAALVQLSGGIELEALLLALKDGDVSALKTAVLASRPWSQALSWQVPLEAWEMPNDSPRESGSDRTKELTKKPEPKEIGFGISVQRFVFDNATPNSKKPKFTGMSSLPPMPLWKAASGSPHQPRGGVAAPRPEDIGQGF